MVLDRFEIARYTIKDVKNDDEDDETIIIGSECSNGIPSIRVNVLCQEYLHSPTNILSHETDIHVSFYDADLNNENEYSVTSQVLVNGQQIQTVQADRRRRRKRQNREKEIKKLESGTCPKKAKKDSKKSSEGNERTLLIGHEANPDKSIEIQILEVFKYKENCKSLS